MRDRRSLDRAAAAGELRVSRSIDVLALLALRRRLQAGLAAGDVDRSLVWTCGDRAAMWLGLQERNPRAADEWLSGIRATILAFGAMPEAHPTAPESRAFDLPIRRVLYGRSTRWRIYYAVIDGTVQVLHVRHGRRSDWRP
jgi:plasmid stabilization system protein ParE